MAVHASLSSPALASASVESVSAGWQRPRLLPHSVAQSGADAVVGVVAVVVVVVVAMVVVVLEFV